jgi:hypothetical protein
MRGRTLVDPCLVVCRERLLELAGNLQILPADVCAHRIE